jgi:hypothetical protein
LNGKWLAPSFVKALGEIPIQPTANPSHSIKRRKAMCDKPSKERPLYFHELTEQWQSEILKICEDDIDIAADRVWFWHNDQWWSYQL